MTSIHSSTPPQSIFISPKTKITSYSKSNFSNWPAELVREFFKNMAKPYVFIKTTHELALCMTINYASYKQIQWLVKYDPIIKPEWDKDKLFLTKLESLLQSDIDILSASAQVQMKWCFEKIFAIAEDSTFTDNQMQFGIERIIKQVQHLRLPLLLLNPDQENKIGDIVFDSLLKRTNIKSFSLSVDDYNPSKFMRKFLKVLNNNSELSYVPDLALESHRLSLEEMESLMQALADKNIDYFELGRTPNRPYKSGEEYELYEEYESYKDYSLEEKGALSILSKYLKDIKIKYLIADDSDLCQPSVLNILKNLPAGVETISLRENHFCKETIELIFEALQDTEVYSLDLSNNSLDNYDAKHLKGISNSLALEKVHLIECYDIDPSNFYGIQNKYGEDINFIFEDKT